MPPSSPGLPPPAHALTRLVAELRPSIARDHAGRVQRRAVDASTLSTGLCGLRTFLRARTQGFIEPGMHIGEDLDGFRYRQAVEIGEPLEGCEHPGILDGLLLTKVDITDRLRIRSVRIESISVVSLLVEMGARLYVAFTERSRDV